jgi:hypothetical protein
MSKNRAVEMPGLWTPRKTKPRFSSAPTIPWESLPRFPHFHRPDDILPHPKQNQKGGLTAVAPLPLQAHSSMRKCRGHFLGCNSSRG